MAKESVAPAKNLGVVDTSVLTETELAELEAQAEKEVLAEQKKAAKALKLAEFKTKHKQKTGLVEAQETITIDLAPYCDRVLIDNRAFLQGQTYTVPVSQAIAIREAMQRTWGHQSRIDGKSENFYRKQRHSHVTDSGAVVNPPNLLRA